MQVSRKIVLTFPATLTTRAITYALVKKFNLIFSIIRAKINNEEEGRLVLEISGELNDYDNGITYLKEQEITIESVSQEVIRNEFRCVSCGACITHCPTGALAIHNRNTMAVNFDKEQCIACGLCIPICPYHAMEVDF